MFGEYDYRNAGIAEILANFVSVWGHEVTFLCALLGLYTFT